MTPNSAMEPSASPRHAGSSSFVSVRRQCTRLPNQDRMITCIRTLRRAAAALFLLACGHATAQPPETPTLSAIDKRFYETLARGAASTDLEQTRKSGGKGGGAFAEICRQGGLLVGFEVW